MLRPEAYLRADFRSLPLVTIGLSMDPRSGAMTACRMAHQRALAPIVIGTYDAYSMNAYAIESWHQLL